MNEYLKSDEDLIKLYKKARTATINELLGLKSSVKRVMALERMWLQDNSESGCLKCNSKNELTVDHIVPEAILNLMGLFPKQSYIPQNYQVLCKRCNYYKANRLDFSNPKTKPLLKEFIDSVI